MNHYLQMYYIFFQIFHKNNKHTLIVLLVLIFILIFCLFLFQTNKETKILKQFVTKKKLYVLIIV